MKLIKITLNKNQYLKNIHYSKINIDNINEEKSITICNLIRKLLLKKKSRTKTITKKLLIIEIINLSKNNKISIISKTQQT